MERQFFPGAGFGPGPFFHPPFHPFFPPFFFPRRRFFPFFFLSPFFFPFFRGEEDRDGQYSAQHQWRDGDTFDSLAETYNCPRPILEAMNPHIQHHDAVVAGTVIYIPRLHKMACHRMYVEQAAPEAGAYPPGYAAPAVPPYSGGVTYPSHYR